MPKMIEISAALHRAEPENKALTLEELKAHCAKGRDAEPLLAPEAYAGADAGRKVGW